jgi:hypothetical protein
MMKLTGMKIRQLRAIIHRYGAAGVLFVGGYLAAHHAWYRQRRTYIVAAIPLVLLSAWLVLRPTPVARVKHRPSVVPLAPPTSPTPVPVAAKLHLNLQDDTQPGPPLSPAISNGIGNGFLVFSATYYHMSGQFYTEEYTGDKEETLAGDETYHLYRVDADGLQRQQLTRGDHHDSGPIISPDGRRVVFTRRTDDQTKLCWMSINGGPVHTLLSFDNDYLAHYSWSPDGRWLAVLSGTEANEQLRLLSLVNGDPIHLAHIEEADWSPDGRLYVRDIEGHARILRPGSAASVPVHDAVRHAVWLDNHTLAGDVEDPGHSDYGDNETLRVIDDRGIEKWQKHLFLLGKQNEYATFSDIHGWHRLPQHPDTLILETWRHMSDGPHYGCYRVDARTGNARLLADGGLMGIAPDGSEVAVADQRWVGPYKRGGERVGPLRIVKLASGRSRAVTDPLAVIDGGAWQSAPPAMAGSGRAALLHAVERNDVAQVSALLTQGSPANVRYADGTTALMIAAGEGNGEMVRLLLRSHADPNAMSPSGDTSLFAAVGAQKAADEVETARQLDIAQALVEAGAHLNTQNHARRTALMEAAANGRALVADWLLRHGAEVNTRDHSGGSALMDAVSNGYAHTAQVLLDHGAAVNLRNKNKETALTVCQDRMNMDDQSDKTTTILLQQAGAKE